MWVHVSQNFSVDAIFTEMLEIASGRKREQLINLDMMQRELEAEIRGRRFFLVLDDVWYDKDPIQKRRLDQLLSPLKAGKQSSGDHSKCRCSNKSWCTESTRYDF